MMKTRRRTPYQRTKSAPRKMALTIGLVFAGGLLLGANTMEALTDSIIVAPDIHVTDTSTTTTVTTTP